MEILNEFVNSIGGKIVLAILAIDTIRAVIASTGVIPRSTKVIGRLIYGKYDEGAIARALQELGYPPMLSQAEHKKLKTHISKMSGTSSVTKENAPIYLVLLLAKYCVFFPQNVSYGGRTMSESKYYLNTMEIVHDRNDFKTMCDIMVMLLYSVSSKKPDVLIAPKGGNPLFAVGVAEDLRSPLLIAKGEGEKSRVKSQSLAEEYQINFEGSSKLSRLEKKQTCAIIDCNLSGGSQLKAIIKELNNYTRGQINNIAKVENVFVLFRADDRHKDVERTFNNMGVSLIRYFDLDEEMKKRIYAIKQKAEQENREVSDIYQEDWQSAEKIVNDLREAKKCFYDPKKKRRLSIQVSYK